MDPRDQLRPLLDGVGCTVCGSLVPAERIRILAHRDDLAREARTSCALRDVEVSGAELLLLTDCGLEREVMP